MFWCALGDRLYLSQDKSVLNEESWFWASESLKHIPKTMIEGCPKCGGKGRKMVFRPYGQGGPYPVNCKTCWSKYLEILEEKGRAA